MNIVVVIDGWNGINGGVVATKRMVNELIKRGHKLTVVSTGSDKDDGEYTFFEVPSFAPFFIKESLEQMEFLFGKGKKDILQKAYDGADLVQVQFPFLMARNAVKVAKKMGIPVIGACHIQPQNIISAMGKESAFMEKMLYTSFNFTLFKQVETIHCPSNLAKTMLEEHGSKAELRVISNGIPNEYKPQKMKITPLWKR